MKNKYTKIHSAISFVDRSKNTAQSYLFVYLFYILFQGGEHSNQKYVLFVSIILFINALIRLFFLDKFSKKKIKLKKALISVKVLSSANAIGWMFLLSLVLFAEQKDIIGIIFTSFISFTLVANSIYVLSSYLWLINIYSILSLLPMILFTLTYNLSNHGNQIKIFSILFLIYYFYVTKQAKRLNKEEKRLYSQQFDLIRNIKRLENAQKELKEQTLNSFHTARLTSLGEMTSSIAHEINNPLSIVVGNTQFLLKRLTNADEAHYEKLYKILFAAERIVKIMKSMKLFSNKSEENIRRENSLNEIIDNTFTLSNDRIKEFNIEVFKSGDLSLLVFCNLIQVTQITINLINNAVDAMESFSSIPENIDKPLQIFIDIESDGIDVSIRISNTGETIPLNIQEKMFQPFFTSKPIGKGTGLGLSISKKLAENNKGGLHYEEYKGMTSFVLKLPLFKNS
jgi:signal transduction histidine kinase